MNILITGGAGFIGSHVALELLRKNYKVFVIDNLSNSSIQSIAGIKRITNKKVFFCEGDIKNNLFLDNFFKKNDIECVIHCAGLKSVSESIIKPIDYYQNNIIGSLNLFSAMKKYKVKKIIFSSSATVYDSNEIMPLTENSKVDFGNNPYARTKVIIEKILFDYFKAFSDISITILRYFNPAGNDPSALIGENPKNTPNNIMPLVNHSFFMNKKFIVYGGDYDTPDGTPIRDYVHVTDLAIGHLKAVDNIIKNQKNEIKIYNLGLGQGISVLELINTYEDVNNIKISYEIGDRRPGDIAICYASNNLVIQELGWKPKFNLRDMCAHSYEWNKKYY